MQLCYVNYKCITSPLALTSLGTPNLQSNFKQQHGTYVYTVSKLRCNRLTAAAAAARWQCFASK